MLCEHKKELHNISKQNVYHWKIIGIIKQVNTNLYSLARETGMIRQLKFFHIEISDSGIAIWNYNMKCTTTNIEIIASSSLRKESISLSIEKGSGNKQDDAMPSNVVNLNTSGHCIIMVR